MNKNRNIINLIKETKAIRKFKNTTVPRSLINKVVNAGIWGPSVLATQPWEYILISNKKIIEKIADICRNNVSGLPSVAQKILRLTSIVIKNSMFLIAVYNNARLSKRVGKYGKKYIKYARDAELLSIGASIQNMYLVSNYLGLGGVWLDSPCIVQDEINNLIGTKLELIAFLAIGYPNMKAKRTKRNKKIKTIKSIR